MVVWNKLGYREIFFLNIYIKNKYGNEIEVKMLML